MILFNILLANINKLPGEVQFFRIGKINVPCEIKMFKLHQWLLIVWYEQH